MFHNLAGLLKLSLLAAALLLVGCAPKATPTQAGQIANPASQNCVDQGGTLTIQERGDGGQYGICTFEDNQQCEEWALFHADCPVGGVKVTGYVTPAAQYCAITGGTYAVTSNPNTDNEQGTCTFKNGSQCDAWDYFNGKCTPGASAVEWKPYANAQVGFTIQIPTTWSQQTLPDQNNGAIHGESFSGTEGGVEVYWGVGFGGACPTGTEPVQLATGEVPACHTTKSDGTEEWSQIDYEVTGGNSFSIRAYTSDAQPSSHDLVLQVVSTLTFMPPAPTGATTIQPLSMEVCDGQAQAMSHTLNDLVPTQSEEPLSDPITGATGTGCQATITGTGVQFESPQAVVSALGGMLADEGWTQDPMLAADGPTGTGTGYRKGDQICSVNARWEPDASANCPKDQAISACPVTPEQKLYTVTLNCGVETAEGQATVSPAGQIVFDSTRGGSGYSDLYVMNSDGHDMSRLTRGEANTFAGPWSPDGQKILFTGFGPTNSYVGVMNADGSGQAALSQQPNSDEAFPAWSPDGKQIAFTSRRDGNNEIYLMNADGSDQARLTSAPGDDFAPTWSPDGSQIAFASDRDRTTGVYSLYVMNSDGSGVKRLTDGLGSDDWPSWSPDGARIAFRSSHDGTADVFVVNVDGSGLQQLTQNQGNNWSPSWSPDGSQIVFQTNRDGNWEIYLMNADGSAPRNLTNDQADDEFPYMKP